MVRKKVQVWLPLVFAIVMALGMIIGYQLHRKTTGGDSFLHNSSTSPLQEAVFLIKNKYVDHVDMDSLQEPAITGLLDRLDPHSVYIPGRELDDINDDLQGNFQGIGIEFQIINDTVNVMNVIPNGPSYKAGVQVGDKIVGVNDTVNLTGKNISTNDVRSQLRGPDGSDVMVAVLRGPSVQKIKITRGIVPLYSLDAAYMLDSVTGYIKLNKFAGTTYFEFMQAMEKLQQQHMQKLVLDLRDNGGGIMQEAVKIADEFLSDDKLIVFTEGANSPRVDYRSEKDGVFEKGKLAVLVDETSASASEIVAGALQDWDRATIIGRRTFGKGLVQMQFGLSNGSAIRLTVARYYTPLGRNIQKPYDRGREQYEAELMNRLHDGELVIGDTSKPTGRSYKTPGGRLVYGGGGITPDIFVPFDTTSQPQIVIQLFSKGIIRNFVYNYFIENKGRFQQYKSPGELRRQFSFGEDDWKNLQYFALKDGVDLKNISASSKNFVLQQMENLLARQIWRTEGYYEFVNANDPMIKKAIEVLGQN